MNQDVSMQSIIDAANAICNHVILTPAVVSPGLSRYINQPVVLKLESMQVSGSFKARGVANKVRFLDAKQKKKGIVAVSGGNHGIAIATIGQTLGIPTTVIMPESAHTSSRQKIRSLNAQLILTKNINDSFAAVSQEQAKGKTNFDPLFDPLITAGHGTIGLEFIRQVPNLTDVMVSIGGGAMISGIATVIKAINPRVKVWGVETSGADAMSQALKVGKPVEIAVTSLVSTLGAPYVRQPALECVSQLVEDIIEVSDRQAVDGAIAFAEHAKVFAEPAAGCLIPAFNKIKSHMTPASMVGMVVCGGNISWDALNFLSQDLG